MAVFSRQLSLAGMGALCVCVLASLRFDHTERSQLCQKFQMLGNLDSEFQITLWEWLELLSSLFLGFFILLLRKY